MAGTLTRAALARGRAMVACDRARAPLDAGVPRSVFARSTIADRQRRAMPMQHRKRASGLRRHA
ncbi:hypothetical protein DGN16_12505 [Xanthomonas citri pv. fuscans]|uniref:Uncharacterized protein n=1 Tax=Xanthomonas citri pv. phaseoli var. fuscans TaxID=473423 RepID=A0A808FJG6_XANCI|nr:hypothetical protein DGN16_12505 [Xanthomonas citri pv. fuscans]QWN08142.1 hypothetical protein DGN11_12550 [Xanthomonas citri pv. fuscans]QWN12373.1 hypothetical protein DGN07_13150 [Xanthomonas citri pv. fuscans]RTE57697.1 hypothetical protein EI541_11490 [Xanthomonas axonopodis pv. eucalyptorum]